MAASSLMCEVEDAEELVLDEYYNNREDSSSEPENESSESGNEEDTSAQSAKKSFLDPCDLDLEEVRAVEDFSAATCKCTEVLVVLPLVLKF